MRFPKLMTTLFHRRTKSDSEMDRLTSPPIANPQTRPISQTSIAGLPIQSLPQSQSAADVLVPIAPMSPLEFSVPFPNPRHPNKPAKTVSFQVDDSHADSPAPPPSGEAVPACPAPHPKPNLGQRRENPDSDADARIASLSAALRAERIAREVAEEACGEYAVKVTALQDEVIQLRRTLFSSVTGPGNQTLSPSFATTLDSIMDASAAGDDSLVVAENIALVVERDRLRRFVELMVSVGGHKPVLDFAYKRVTGQGEGVGGGEDPEAALAGAIKEAVRQPNSVWREVLEPVTGARTQDEYLAQVRCTLDARKQTTDWRKRAWFWKGKAKEDGRNGDTVTPSASALSEVADGIPAEKRTRTGEKLERGPAAPHAIDVAIPRGLDDVLSPTASRFALDMVSHWNTDSFEPNLELTLPAASSSMVLPAATRPASGFVDKPLPASPTGRGSNGTIYESSSQTSLKFRHWNAGMRFSTESARSTGSNYSAQEAVQASAVSEGSTAVASPLGADFSLLPDPKEIPGFGEGLDRDLVLVLHDKLSSTPPRLTALAPAADAESERGSESGTSSSASSPKKSRLPVRMRGLRVIKRLSTTFSVSRAVVTETT